MDFGLEKNNQATQLPNRLFDFLSFASDILHVTESPPHTNLFTIQHVAESPSHINLFPKGSDCATPAGSFALVHSEISLSPDNLAVMEIRDKQSGEATRHSSDEIGEFHSSDPL